MDMRRALKDRLAGYKIPQEMKVLEAIPRNAMGKGEFFSSRDVGLHANIEQ
jgi:non-ribosomal peptide synthetase component E (peptide arylation enzyme)